MGRKEKRRRRKPSALAERVLNLLLDLISAILAGLATAAIMKLIGW